MRLQVSKFAVVIGICLGCATPACSAADGTGGSEGQASPLAKQGDKSDTKYCGVPFESSFKLQEIRNRDVTFTTREYYKEIGRDWSADFEISFHRTNDTSRGSEFFKVSYNSALRSRHPEMPIGTPIKISSPFGGGDNVDVSVLVRKSDSFSEPDFFIDALDGFIVVCKLPTSKNDNLSVYVDLLVGDVRKESSRENPYGTVKGTLDLPVTDYRDAKK